jgi:hypothetical protein
VRNSCQIWNVVKSFSKLRNIFAHSQTYGTQAGKKEIESMANHILVELKKIRPDILPTVNDKRDIVELAAFTVNHFFREIRDALARTKLSG